MIHFISKLSTACVKSGVIDANDILWFEYGIKTRIATFTVLVPFSLLAIKLSGIPTTLAFLAAFQFLRTRTSGYHANSVLGCISVSLILEFFFLGVFLPHLNTAAIYISNGVSLVAIDFLAPFVHPNMNFSKEEIQALRHSAKKRAALTAFLALMCCGLNFTAFAKGLTTGTAMAAFMLCLAHFIDWRKST